MEYLQETHKQQLQTCSKGHYKPNHAQHTETSTVPEPNTGINVTLKEQKQNNRVRVTSTYIQNVSQAPRHCQRSWSTYLSSHL